MAVRGVCLCGWERAESVKTSFELFSNGLKDHSLEDDQDDEVDDCSQRQGMVDDMATADMETKISNFESLLERLSCLVSLSCCVCSVVCAGEVEAVQRPSTPQATAQELLDHLGLLHQGERCLLHQPSERCLVQQLASAYPQVHTRECIAAWQSALVQCTLSVYVMCFGCLCDTQFECDDKTKDLATWSLACTHCNLLSCQSSVMHLAVCRLS